MLKIQNFVIVLGMLFIMVACSEQQPKDEYKFIEYLKVEGTCYENHVKISANYSGSFVHWYNKTKDQHSRYGSVHHTEALTTEKLNEKIKNPYKYYPPFSVEFGVIPPDQFSKVEMKLNGISKHMPQRESEEGARYEATCILRVLERLDYLPSDQSNKKSGR